MPRDFSMDNVSDMLDGLKLRLGFSHGDDRHAADDYGYDDYGDYDEYGDYGDGQPDDVQASSQSSSSQRRTSRFGRADSSPNLVSFDDVKYSTPVPEIPRTESVAHTTGSYSSTTNVGGHTVIDATVPVPSSPAYKAAMRDGVVRNEGASSLFEPSMPVTAGGAYDPYEAYSSSNPSSYTKPRALTVVKPVIYGDVERVARAVKSGDVVVLSMKNTPDELSKRILDFSFGVASALDANVECPGDKVFAIARGSALTDDEKRRLKAQSIL